MSKITDPVWGVTRLNQFSPNHIGNDAAIFNLVVDCLRAQGYEVNVVSEDEFCASDQEFRYIFNMARSLQTIDKLKQLEDQGAIVINSGYGIENCTREKMTQLLLANDIPHPRSLIVNTNTCEDPFVNLHTFIPCWIKRGDFHAIHREDVSYVRNSQEGISLLKEYALRGIQKAVINEHLEGDLVKFYGVADTDFFYWFYPFDIQHSKFGLEKINGVSRGYHFDKKELQKICQKSAEILKISIYGGDCIVNASGEIRIIDFNDWPSFAPCREAAAPYIAKIIQQKFLMYSSAKNKKTHNLTK